MDDFSEDDWCLTCSLTCHECQTIIDGFEACVQHAKTCENKVLSKRVKNAKLFSCICCPKSFSSKDLLKNHVKRHVFNDNDQFSAAEKQYWNCQRCESKAFKGITKYISHLDDIHPNEDKIPCPACSMQINSIKELKIHVMEHVTETNGDDTVAAEEESFNFDQIHEDSEGSEIDEFIENIWEEDNDDLDDEDFNIVVEATKTPPKRKRGRPRKKDIMSSDDEFEPVLKQEILDAESLFNDSFYDFYDELQIIDKNEKENLSDRETRKLRSKRIQENKNIHGKIEDSNIIEKGWMIEFTTFFSNFLANFILKP